MLGGASFLSKPFGSFLGLGSQASFLLCDFLQVLKEQRTSLQIPLPEMRQRFSAHPTFRDLKFLDFFAEDESQSQK